MFVPLVVTEIFFVGLNENDFDNQLGKLQCNFLDAAIWKKIDQSNVYWRNSMEVVNIS